MEELGRLDNLTVTMLGDLKYGRTVHSLARLLSQFKDIKLNYVSPDILRMPREVMDEVAEKKVPQAEFGSLEKVLPETDVLYVTRVQKERFEDPADYEKVKGAYVIDPEIMKAAKQEMIVMHPLPRVGEISLDFDDDPRAAYFRQMEYGLYVRMALLAMVLGKAKYNREDTSSQESELRVLSVLRGKRISWNPSSLFWKNASMTAPRFCASGSTRTFPILQSRPPPAALRLLSESR